MSESRLAVGIDFGATTVKAGVVYQSHVIDHAPHLATKEFGEPAELIEAMVRSVAELREKHPGISALGVGLPGFVDFHKGWVHGLTNVPQWESIPLGRILEEKTGLPTVIDNRANCMAEAEWKCGAARGMDDVIFINIETGVGGAVIANGNMIRGCRHVAGEIGQSSIDWRGRVGEFGNAGALERYIGTAEILSDAREAYGSDGQVKPACEVTLAALVSAAHRHDPVAMARWDEIGGVLAAAVANACWLLNPEAVVVGGSLTRAGELFFKPFREQLFARLSYPFKDHLMVVPAAFGSESGTIGAAALALEEVGDQARDFSTAN